MKKLRLITVITLVLLLSSCATKSIPRPEDLQRLNQDEIKLLIIGNTLTYQAIWGRWAEYHREDYTGFAAAWATLFSWYGWSEDKATSSFEFTDNAEICWRYSGESDWANPDNEYCAVIYSGNGMYYLSYTKNPRDPALVGQLHELEIKKGDYYELLE